MTNKEKKDWLAVKYPLTVIRDRYEGTYSGAMWLAFPLDRDEVPEDVDGEDPECMYFWEYYQEPVGKGAYASDAVADLIQQMRESEPEESEDERVRKEMVSMIKECTNWAHKKEYIAYLEKQAENPKSADSIPSDCVSVAKCEDRCQKHSISVDELAQDYVDGVKEYNPEPTWDLIQTAVCYGYHYREQKEQKPAEWSEEDELMIITIIQTLETLGGRGTTGMQIDWLKSLRPQPKQEKSDYITPHKQFFKWIYDRLVSVHKENPDADYMISFKKRIEELSFDNPSWKPSEEQMEALEYVIRDYREDSCNATANYLQEILDHLKNM